VNDLLLLLVLLSAVGAGWFLGRLREPAPKPARKTSSKLPSQYYRGLNFLLDDSQDQAIDAFTQALEVNTETLDTHIALGNILRRRGEVERAIRIHQNLLARPSLPVAQLYLAHLELARDYISAGLLDRAERLLLDLVEESGPHRRVARRHLLEIYEAQRDWGTARAVAEQLLPRRSLLKTSAAAPVETGQPIPVLLAHYCCEQAAQLITRGDYTSGRGLLNEALKHDPNCVRATMALGELEVRAGQPAKAIKVLQTLAEQEPEFVPETAPLLREAMSLLDRRKELISYLESCYRRKPSTPLGLAIAEELRATAGAESAKKFLRDQLKVRPSLRGLAMLMALHSDAEAGDDEALQINTINKLVEARSSYQCGHCGFRGQQLHWYCPGCKHWGTIRDLGVTGEVVRA